MADPEKAMESAENNETGETEEAMEDDDSKLNDIAEGLMKNPKVLAAVQSRFAGLNPLTYLSMLPKCVKRRIKALKRIQLDSTKLEAKFYEEVHALECKYVEQYAVLYEKRFKITTGVYEPTEPECEWESDDDEDEELSNALESQAKIEDSEPITKPSLDENAKGIPHFWLTVLKNVDELAEIIQEQDEPILEKLTDITIKLSESNPMGFTLVFHFEPNEYFTNSTLTKDYELNCAPDENDPFSFEGPEIIKCKGCSIDWSKGKNVTVKTIKKKQKHKSRGSIRTITKTVQNPSFFNFFSPPTVPEDKEGECDEETRANLANDFEIGHFLRERIIPRAVLYFTGEALEDEEYEEEGDEDEEGGEEEEDEEEEAGDTRQEARKVAKVKKENPNAECKQQ